MLGAPVLGGKLAAEQLNGAVEDHLVSVYVGVHAGAGLPNNQRGGSRRTVSPR